MRNVSLAILDKVQALLFFTTKGIQLVMKTNMHIAKFQTCTCSLLRWTNYSYNCFVSIPKLSLSIIF